MRLNEVESFDEYDVLGSYESLLDNYTSQLFYEGLDENDYNEIFKIVMELTRIYSNASGNLEHYISINRAYIDKIKFINIKKEKEFFLHEVSDLRDRFCYLYEQLKPVVEPRSLRAYLQDSGSLVHLVGANNTFPKVKLYSFDSFMFLCQFHKEQTPSLGVSNGVGLGFCFGCGESFNLVDYIRLYENCTFHEAIYILARVYLIDLDYNPCDENDPRVLKYREYLLSDSFKNLLTRGYERTKKRAKDYSGYNSSRALKKYAEVFQTIDRVRSGEHKKFVRNKKGVKKLIMQMPNFE